MIKGLYCKYGGKYPCDTSVSKYVSHIGGIYTYDVDPKDRLKDHNWYGVLKDTFKEVSPRGDLPNVYFTSNHCLNVAVLAPYLKEYPNVVYIDAHLDANTWDTSPSKKEHGMGLACLGHVGDPDVVSLVSYPVNKVYAIGTRSTDFKETSNLKNLSICGFGDIPKDEKICISIDVDALDPKFYKSCHYNVENGLSPKKIKNFLAFLDLDRVGVIEISEINNLTKKDIGVLDYMLSPILHKCA